MKNILIFILLSVGLIYLNSDQWISSDYNIADINLNHFVVEVDGSQREFYTFHEETEKVLEQEKIHLQNKDYYNVEFKEGFYYVRVIRSYDKTLTVVKEIPFPKEIKNNPKIAKGFTKVVQKGRPGLKEMEYRITYEEGKEKYREFISESTIIPPKPEIILKGQRAKAAIASGRPEHSKQVLSMEATAYTHTGNTTFTGVYPKAGTIAVDPRVIPLGTKLWIDGYGYGIAEDTGKAIKGEIIDLFMETKEECFRWGRRDVNVYILGE